MQAITMILDIQEQIDDLRDDTPDAVEIFEPEILHESHPIQVVRKEGYDYLSVELIKGYIVPSSKSDFTISTLLQIAITCHVMTDDEIIEIANALARYING